MTVTPLRALGARGPDGCVLLRDVGLDYRDGGEEAVLKLILDAKDVSSTSDELIRGAEGWAQTYHLHPARANVLRAVRFPPDARVLEIGAGCGAITRYLGEVCGAVDALEPVPARAAAARARTRDLDNVEVFVGELDDVPAEAAYDVVVVIGVLEYVAAGGADRTPYLDFLRGVRRRLVDGGTLVLAIENALGVKYLAGAPEDHSNRPFDSLEGYPVGTPARTFSRRELTAMLSSCGFAPTYRSAFPDYKLTRAVLGELPESTRSLLHRIPQFPSPDWVSPRPQLADERSLWRTLVDAGLDADTGNSFLVLGSTGGDTLWPDGVGATFWSTGRRSRFAATTSVEVHGESVRFVRRPLTDEGPASTDRFGIVGSDHPYQPGTDLLDYVARTPDADIAGLLSQWLQLLAATEAEGRISPDIVPHNLVIGDDGAVAIIDVELLGDVPHEQVVRRGLFWMAHHVAMISPAGRWGDAETIRDVAILLGSTIGLDRDGAWTAVALAEECALQLEIQNGPQLGLDWDAWEERFAEVLRNDIDRKLADLPLGDRLPERMRATVEQAAADRRAASDEMNRLHAELGEALARYHDLDTRFVEVLNSRPMRLAASYRRARARIAPPGTRRRSLFERLSGRTD